jgi:hypothetical protein
MDQDGNTEKLHIVPTGHGKTAPCFSNVLAPSKNKFISWRTTRTLEIYISQSYSHVSAASFPLPFIIFILLIQSGMFQAQALTWTERTVPAVHIRTQRAERERENLVTPPSSYSILSAIFDMLQRICHITMEANGNLWIISGVFCHAFVCVFSVVLSGIADKMCISVASSSKTDCVTFPVNNPNAPFVHPRDTQAFWDLWPFWVCRSHHVLVVVRKKQVSCCIEYLVCGTVGMKLCATIPFGSPMSNKSTMENADGLLSRRTLWTMLVFERYARVKCPPTAVGEIVCWQQASHTNALGKLWRFQMMKQMFANKRNWWNGAGASLDVSE